MRPLVSIIVPVYNTEKYLRQCLDSILAQTYRELELIAVDDGSTDASPEILREYAQKDARVQVLTQQNKFAGCARNYGIGQAKGEYFQFLDSDDFCEPEMLEREMEVVLRYDADLCVCGGVLYHNDTGRCTPFQCLNPRLTPKRLPFRARELGCDAFRFASSMPSNKLVRRALVERYALRFQPLRATNDLYFICMCEALAERIVVTEDKPLYYYRVDTGSNLQSHTFRSPLDNVRAGTALKEGLTREGTLEPLRKGYENFMAYEIERYAKRMSGHAEAFAQMYEWYRGEGRSVYDLHISSMDPGTLANLLMTFDGITLEMTAEEARARLLTNLETHGVQHEGRKLDRTRFLLGRLNKRIGVFRTIGRMAAYAALAVRRKLRNRA